MGIYSANAEFCPHCGRWAVCDGPFSDCGCCSPAALQTTDHSHREPTQEQPEMSTIYQFNEELDFKANNLIKAYPDDAGWDIRCPWETIVYPGTPAKINTGLHICIPPGFVGICKSRSGLSLNQHLDVCNAGVIDAGYHGSIILMVINTHPSTPVSIGKGERFAQLIIHPSCTVPLKDVWHISFPQHIPEVPIERWPITTRGHQGVGSTGTE